MQTPKIGEPVKVVYLDPELGSIPTIAYGALGVELNEDGRAIGVVVENDGGATFISPRDIIRVEADEEATR